MKHVFSFLLVFAFITQLSACNQSSFPDEWVKHKIIGCPSHPDVILHKIKALEKRGEIHTLNILESFPVQLHFKASQETIDTLSKFRLQNCQH